MKRLAAALFGLFVAVGVLSAAPASATGIQVTGNVYNTAVISINDGTVEFYDSCDAQTPVATDSFITASYSAEVPAYGTYYVRILPAQGFAALASWNGGSDTCAGSDAITVSDGNTFHGVFAMLDTLETRMGKSGPYLFGKRLTETDIRLFVTLVRFDAAYHGLFKTNLRRIADYPRLSSFIDAMLAVPGLRETVNIDHIKCGYYSIKALNPNGVVPIGPKLSFAA